MARHRQDEPTAFVILYVCTGNICRSPFAEILTRHLLGERLGAAAAATAFTVSSAGTRAATGAPMHPATRTELGPPGRDDSTGPWFTARQLQPSMIDRSDLVLGMTPQHRSAVVGCSPAALRTAFSLREFARLATSVDPALLGADPVSRARTLTKESLTRRGLQPPVGPGGYDVPDPMGGPTQAHRHAARLIRDAVRTIVEIIAPDDDGPRPMAARPEPQ